ncbi:MAG: hypothetical protein K0R14_86 [Burkholderiales bacterium]|jgi:hypothetical protein|nr:hypothetical protein [Burkholderiales bacterium]
MKKQIEMSILYSALLGIFLINNVGARPASLRMSCIPTNLPNFNNEYMPTAPWSINVYEDPENPGNYNTTLGKKVTDVQPPKGIPSFIEGKTDEGKTWVLSKQENIPEEDIKGKLYSSFWYIGNAIISHTFVNNWGAFKAGTTKRLNVSGMYKCTRWYTNSNDVANIANKDKDNGANSEKI